MTEQEQNGANQDVKRWTAKRKAALVLDLIKGTTTVAQAARTYDLTPAEIEEWLEEGLRGMENNLRSRPKDVAEQYESQIKDLQAKVGELVLEVDVLKKSQASVGPTPQSIGPCRRTSNERGARSASRGSAGSWACQGEASTTSHGRDGSR